MADRFPSLDEIDAGVTDVRDVDNNSSFLEREKALLGDDAAEFATASDSRIATVEDGDDDLLGGDEMQFAAPSNQEAMDFENEFPDISAQDQGITSSYPPPVAEQSLEDSAPIAEWRAKRAADIEKRDRISADKRQVTINEARQTIDDFYDSYNDKKEKNIAQTRKEEKEFLESRDDTTAGGTSWERISKLVDISGKGSKGGAPASGKERFRELLVSLRKDEKAPGVSGI